MFKCGCVLKHKLICVSKFCKDFYFKSEKVIKQDNVIYESTKSVARKI